MNDEHLSLLRTIRLLLLCVVLTFVAGSVSVTAGLFYAGYQVNRFSAQVERAGEKVEAAGRVVTKLIEPFDPQPGEK